jgi:hypothetical protein
MEAATPHVEEECKAVDRISTSNSQDYQHLLGSIKQASEYKITMSYLINHIKKKYAHSNNIATALA